MPGKKEKLLVDYLEDSAAYLDKKKKKLQDLNRQYNEIYDKELREEMDIVRKEIRKKNAEVVFYVRCYKNRW